MRHFRPRKNFASAGAIGNAVVGVGSIWFQVKAYQMDMRVSQARVEQQVILAIEP